MAGYALPRIASGVGLKGVKMNETTQSQIFPVLPLRDIVVFPHMIVPLFVGRDKSVRALEDVMNDDKQILLVAQKDASKDDPGEEDIHKVGTVASVLQLLKLPDGSMSSFQMTNFFKRMLKSFLKMTMRVQS